MYMERYRLPEPRLHEDEQRLLKFADMLDLVLSSIEEWGRGNRYARQLVENGGHYLLQGGYPQEWMLIADEMVKEVKGEWLQTTDR